MVYTNYFFRRQMLALIRLDDQPGHKIRRMCQPTCNLIFIRVINLLNVPTLQISLLEVESKLRLLNKFESEIHSSNTIQWLFTKSLYGLGTFFNSFCLTLISH